MPASPLSIRETLRDAITAYEVGDLPDTERRCKEIVGRAPDYFEAIYLLAVTQSRLGHFADALVNYDDALEIRPGFAEAYNNRGLLLHDLARYPEALANFDRALALAPDDAGAWFNRGVTLQSLDRPNDAVASYDKALAIRPDHADALNNRGNALETQRRYAEALASYDGAVAIAPDHAKAHSNRGNVLIKMGRFTQALASLDTALSLQPDFAEARDIRGNALAGLRRFDEALASYGEAQALLPDYPNAHHNEAMCRLLRGDYARGFEKYEWRWHIDAVRPLRRDFAQPLWSGREDIRGRTILIHAEQGFGDTIQFSRYVKMVAERGARVVLEVQPALTRLFAALDGTAAVVARGEPLPSFDLHCPLLSLPLAFGTMPDTIPPPCELPPVPAEIMDAWRARLRPPQSPAVPRVGIVWSGNPAHGNDHGRSIRLSALAPLLAFPVEFVSLQTDVPAHDAEFLRGARITHFGTAISDFLDTAALVRLMDIVVCVDTAVAHLAATLGRRSYILLPHLPDWRWLLDRPDSPWYPAARLVRQSRADDWDEVISRVAGRIRDDIAAGGLPTRDAAR